MVAFGDLPDYVRSWSFERRPRATTFGATIRMKLREYFAFFAINSIRASTQENGRIGPAAPADEALHLSNEGSKFASLAIYFTAYK